MRTAYGAGKEADRQSVRAENTDEKQNELKEQKWKIEKSFER